MPLISTFNKTRRHLLGGLAAGAALAGTGLPRLAKALPEPPDVSPESLARDEAFWKEVGSHYDRTEGILNLEHGYWGRMARPVRQAYFDNLHSVDTQNSYYVRREYNDAEANVVRKLADAQGVHPDELVITRNATEAVHNLIRQYRGLEKGDAVLLADIDYPGFKTHMHWLATGRGVRIIELALPQRANQQQLRDAYIKAFDANPDLKLMLIMHVSNQHGLVVPVAEISAEAKKRGIDVICDAAQSWGLLDYQVGELGADWVAFNLHKWIGAPLGTGLLYMRRGSLANVSPHPSEQGEDRVASRVHPGTFNFAARLTIPEALDFHASVGAANKEARLRYLRSRWSDAALDMKHLEVLGGADEASWTGIGSFRLSGRNSIEDATALQLRLEKEFGIFSVVRKGLASGGCVRITPQVFNTPLEMSTLVDALHRLKD